MAAPNRATTALPLGGVEVKMSNYTDPVIGIDDGHGLYTQYLTSCTAVATFCYHGSHGTHRTLTHVGAVDAALGRKLARWKHVHDGDTIVIALGADIMHQYRGAEFKRAKDALKQGLAEHGVTTINWIYDYAGADAHNQPNATLDAGTYVVQSNDTCGRAARPAAVQANLYPTSGGAGSHSDHGSSHSGGSHRQGSGSGGSGRTGGGGGSTGAHRNGASRGGRAGY